MANRKKNKLDIHAETRLWNLSLKNQQIATKDLADEMIYRFHLGNSAWRDQDLQKIILAARRRVMRRRSKMKKNISAWALKLFLPEKVVAQWAVNGWLTEKNFAAVYEILSAYRALLISGEIETGINELKIREQGGYSF
ncbi:MAG: hypothetical protein AVO38_03620 [delta proteobacterium ML8_D]|nr:MAG: hypothetical protein AVO38_03620 [delta proteobacterium ML8_D]